MKFNTVKSIIFEFIALTFIVGILIVLLFNNFIEIYCDKFIIKASLIIILFYAIYCFFSIVNLGIRALIDYIFQKTITDKYIFMREEPYDNNIFTGKFDENHEQTIGIYYIIYAQKNNRIYTFISSSYKEMYTGKIYTIKAGKYSNILVSCE